MSKYSIISEKRRLQLIDLIKKDGKTIVSAAKKLKIKISTAKSILYSFQKNGKVLKKKKHYKTHKLKNLGLCEVEVNRQVSNNMQREQIKKQEEIKPQQTNERDPMNIKPLLMFDPVLMHHYWNYYLLMRQFQNIQIENGEWLLK